MLGIAGLPNQDEFCGARGLYGSRAFFLRISNLKKEVVQMLLMFKECPFYRASESLSMGRGIGYCDLDCDRATCEGDQHLCEKPDALKKYLSEQKKREKGNAYFSRAYRI